MKTIYKASGFIVGLSLIFQFTYAQKLNQGLGLRIGDPVGISYKAYLPGSTAVEFTLGTTSRNRHSAYYKDTFNALDRYDGLRYSDHDVKYTLALQGRYLLHNPFPANVEGRLDWYWGLGGQFRLSKVEYTYFSESTLFANDTKTNIDLGPEGILGVEYEFKDYPIVGFSEVSLLGEIVDKPLRFRFFAAVGVRYAFNSL
ncbi:hypothetical protein GCM10009122_15650 [Fulvivirga kasyanovii]|uniref:Outer membrane protein beta-barrel domain-containing protein n=1 Tax=Fulvivirga kasyanovii TaxID=396812 RepID=A0ABW9RV54_9BACT|nr:hypothetical protein [Fulvivirga kasyanovii]MTI28088.1 hypothetical protein [Fulvivirga kasyanovii]